MNSVFLTSNMRFKKDKNINHKKHSLFQQNNFELDEICCHEITEQLYDKITRHVNFSLHLKIKSFYCLIPDDGRISMPNNSLR